jgi:succinate dehydrogenase / fumarate reductase iron-sulfur subunit
MVINGAPRLACSTQVLDVSRETLRVEPLWNFDIVKDLVADQTPMFAKHASVRPYLVRHDAGEIEQAETEYRQSPEELIEYLQFSYCIKCGLCLAACPTVATDAGYLGPMPLTAARRYNADSRDQGFVQRLGLLEAAGGAFHCHYAGECSRACPKGVDPARAVQLLKRSLLFPPKT